VGVAPAAGVPLDQVYAVARQASTPPGSAKP
jgi:hypothetical protein